MKKLLILLLLIPVLAAAEEADEVDICQDFANSAAMIMELRQNGADMSDVLQKLKGFEPAKSIIMAAWSVPQYSTLQYQRNAIVMFKNEVFLSCLKGVEEAENDRE